MFIERETIKIMHSFRSAMFRRHQETELIVSTFSNTTGGYIGEIALLKGVQKLQDFREL